MRVLITDTTGLLGGHLLHASLQRNEQIRALVLPAKLLEKLLGQGVEVIRGDVTDSITLSSALKDLAGARKI